MLTAEELDALAERLADPIAERLAERLDSRPLLTIKEAAEFLRIGSSKLYLEIAAGRLRPVRLGEQSPRFEAREIDRYVATLRDGDDGHD